MNIIRAAPPPEIVRKLISIILSANDFADYLWPDKNDLVKTDNL
jgi:hypothetical protein